MRIVFPNDSGEDRHERGDADDELLLPESLDVIASRLTVEAAMLSDCYAADATHLTDNASFVACQSSVKIDRRKRKTRCTIGVAVAAASMFCLAVGTKYRIASTDSANSHPGVHPVTSVYTIQSQATFYVPSQFRSNHANKTAQYLEDVRKFTQPALMINEVNGAEFEAILDLMEDDTSGQFTLSL